MSFSETGSERGEVRGETREGEIARDDSLPRRGEGRASEFLHVASNYSVCLSELIPIGRIIAIYLSALIRTLLANYRV